MTPPYKCTDAEIETIIRVLQQVNPDEDVFAERNGDGWQVYVGEDIYNKVQEIKYGKTDS